MKYKSVSVHFIWCLGQCYICAWDRCLGTNNKDGIFQNFRLAMDLRTVVQTDDADRKAKHCGRAYQCLKCLHKDNKVIDVKRRIEAHITKYQLRLDECAHYCRLCFFSMLGQENT